jgi:hypothetical protein
MVLLFALLEHSWDPLTVFLREMTQEPYNAPHLVILYPSLIE